MNKTLVLVAFIGMQNSQLPINNVNEREHGCSVLVVSERTSVMSALACTWSFIFSNTSYHSYQPPKVSVHSESRYRVSYTIIPLMFP